MLGVQVPSARPGERAAAARPRPLSPSPGTRQAHPRPTGGARASGFPNTSAGWGQPSPGVTIIPHPRPSQGWAPGPHAPRDRVLPLSRSSQSRELAAPLPPSLLLFSGFLPLLFLSILPRLPSAVFPGALVFLSVTLRLLLSRLRP